jgi:hypothetical protein
MNFVSVKNELFKKHSNTIIKKIGTSSGARFAGPFLGTTKQVIDLSIVFHGNKKTFEFLGGDFNAMETK